MTLCDVRQHNASYTRFSCSWQVVFNNCSSCRIISHIDGIPVGRRNPFPNPPTISNNRYQVRQQLFAAQQKLGKTGRIDAAEIQHVWFQRWSSGVSFAISSREYLNTE